MKVSDIDFSKVPQRTIKKFMLSGNINRISDLVPVCYLPSKEPYSRHTWEMIIEAPIEKVWNAYIYSHPTVCWDSKMISFGLMYDRNTNEVLYREDQFEHLSTGQLYFINLKILGSALQIPVMHEINKIDHEEKVIQTCYLKLGKSEGSQWIRLFETEEGHTKIVHETVYKGDSKIREKHLYPIFHTKAIKQFHNNIKKALLEDKIISQSLRDSA